MSDIYKLWEIEQHYSSIEKYYNTLKGLEQDENLKTLKNESSCINQKLEKLTSTINEEKMNIRRLEQTVEIHNNKLKNQEHTLYGGSVTDLKQMEHLESENIFHKETIDSLENKMLDSIELVEEKEKETIELLERMKVAEYNIKDRENQVNSLKVELLEELKKEENTVQEIINTVDKNLFKDYKRIRERKGSGIAIVKNDVCMGCHMIISENLVEKVKLEKKMEVCENCGRILYSRNND